MSCNTKLRKKLYFTACLLSPSFRRPMQSHAQCAPCPCENNFLFKAIFNLESTNASTLAGAGEEEEEEGLGEEIPLEVENRLS